MVVTDAMPECGFRDAPGLAPRVSVLDQFVDSGLQVMVELEVHLVLRPTPPAAETEKASDAAGPAHVSRTPPSR